MTQSPVAASKETLRAAEKSPSHSWCRTRAPRPSAISTVRSVEPGVDDDDLVDGVAGGLQAAPDHRLLVLDDHAQADGQALGRAGGGGDAVDARLQVAHGAGGLRQHAHARALAARALGEVALDVGQLGVQALGGGEQRLRRP